MTRFVLTFAIATAALTAPVFSADIVWENARFKLVLGEDAVWKSLVDKAGGKECCFAAARSPFAQASVIPSLPSGSAGGETSVADHQKLLAQPPAAKRVAANAAAFAGGKLSIHFAGCDTQLVYAVKVQPDYVLFTLAEIRGARPTELTLLRFCTTLNAHVGPRLGLGWDGSYGVGVMGGNIASRGQAIRRKDHAELLVTTQDAPGPKLEGAAAAIYAAPEADLDALLTRMSRELNLPRNEGPAAACSTAVPAVCTTGVPPVGQGRDGPATHGRDAHGTHGQDARATNSAPPSRLLPLARRSYWFLYVPQKDVDRVIELCRTSGINQVMMMSGSWCRTVGHFTFNTAAYPDGLPGLQAAVKKMHDAGILVGMHGFASKISKSDAYVTPIPDKRFWVDLSTRLAGDVGADDTTIRSAGDLRQWPGSPVASQKLWEGGVDKHREVILDDEIVAYESIGPEGRWDTFLGCKRGAWKTVKAAHKAGTAGRHYGVDGCINGYIIDQETTLLDELTTRLAEVFNTCGFDMVYFDGGEDVDRRRFDYYVTKFQAVAMSKFTRRPLIHMGTIMTHGVWHSFTRSGTVDTYLNTLNGHIQAGGKIETWPTVRDHIDRSVQYMLSIGEDRMVGELGWFGIWPKGKNTDGLQLDEAEYLMCKSLAHDAPISLETSLPQMASHPLTGGILEIVKAYEEIRAGGKIDAATRKRLAEPKKDFLLYYDKPGAAAEFLECVPTGVASGRDVRAMLAQRGPDVVASVWHYTGRPGALEFGLANGKPRASDLAGGEIGLASEEVGGYLLALPPRRVNILLPGKTIEQAKEILNKARFEAVQAKKN